ncbi:FAD-dependent oxidoreductase [Streptomyces sp. NPDC046805]|uniref:FAD-dependent oxidoreductase n=1 Tax=Streptomyces sp. NPDC046805 TaxID=3155134 RepID=UPI0033F000B9
MIIGGGYLGLEFASVYSRFGSEVTLLEAAPHILGREDDDVAAAVRTNLTNDGIAIVTGARVLVVSDGMARVTVTCERNGAKYSIDVDAVLAAAGRRPAIAGLGLEAVGVRTSDRGTCVQASRTSMHSATSTADPGSPMSALTTAVSFSTGSSARAGGAPLTGSRCRTRCSSPRCWPPSGSSRSRPVGPDAG